MAGSKEIKAKIKSVGNTKKITKAMEMVAASKMRKAQDNMLATRPYAEKIRSVIGHLSKAHPEYKHPFIVERENVKRVGVIVISTDRGLCGGLNSNLFRNVIREAKDFAAQEVEVDLAIFGRKAQSFFQSVGGNVVAEAVDLGDQPEIAQTFGTMKIMLDAYIDGTIDEIYIARNYFVTSMSQKPAIDRLVPIAPVEAEQSSGQWDYIYEPEAKPVLDTLLTRYIESQVYQAIVENIACEMSARMIAMKNATDNAGDMIKQLKTIYNKARQAAITQEISEIVGGAAAVS